MDTAKMGTLELSALEPSPGLPRTIWKNYMPTIHLLDTCAVVGYSSPLCEAISCLVHEYFEKSLVYNTIRHTAK